MSRLCMQLLNYGVLVWYGHDMTNMTRSELVADTQRALQGLIQNGRARLQLVVREYGLTVPQASFLLFVDRNGPTVTMGEVTEALQITASTTTSIAYRLVDLGLINRGSNPEDRRVVVASLTDDGHQIVDGIKSRRSRAFAALLDQFSDAEVEQFHDTVQRIIDAMDTIEP